MIRDGRSRRDGRRRRGVPPRGNGGSERPFGGVAGVMRRKKARKPRISRQVLFAILAPCLAILYGMAINLVFLHRNHIRSDFHRFRGPTKQEQRARLQQKQKQRMEEVELRRREKEERTRQEHELDLDLAAKKFLSDRNHRRHNPTSKKTIHFQRKYPRMIYFLHIHKSAGSFFCKQAFENRMAADYERNCNVRDDQRCCSNSTQDTEFSASSQIAFAQTAPYDLVATEKELPGILLPDYYDYVVSLRDSKARYESHWNHLVRTAEEKKQRKQQRGSKKMAVSGGGPPDEDSQQESSLSSWIGGILKGPYKREASSFQRTEINDPNRYKNPSKYWKRHNPDVEYDPDDPGHYNLTVRDPVDGHLHPVGNYTKWVEGQPDNYNLRMICGAHCWNASKFRITKDMFEYTLERLWVKFSHILFVEDMEASFRVFATAYGWNVSLQEASTADTVSSKKEKKKNSTPSWWDPYTTVLDDAVYEMAKRKHRLASLVHSKNTSGNAATMPTRLVWKNDYEPFENQALLDKYFREGPASNCTNACCGYCSKW